jgi:glucose dehydrogenase
MGITARTLHPRAEAPDSHRDHAVRTVLAFAGAMLSLVGAILAVGGYRSAMSGSAFYMFVGAALIVSGILMARRHQAGAWTYMAVFSGVLAWSLREAHGGSSLAFRLVGPVILLALLALLMPVLSNWCPRRAAMTFLGLASATIGLGAASHAYRSPHACPTTALCGRADNIEHQSDFPESRFHARTY